MIIAIYLPIMSLYSKILYFTSKITKISAIEIDVSF